MLSPIKNPTAVFIDKDRSNKTYRVNSQHPKQQADVEVTIGQQKIEPVIYDKPVSAANKAEIESMKKRFEDFIEPLRIFVDRLVSKQAEILKKVEIHDLKPSKEEIQKFKELISEDGELGVNKTADRIVEFAKALSGEDKSKIPQLREAIEKGFKEAEKLLGGLPEVSVKTHDEVMKRLDEWEKS